MIGMLILAISAGAFALSFNIWTITPKREAERLFAKLSSLMLKADRTQTHFKIEVDSDKIRIQWNSEYTDLVNKRYVFIEDFPASKGVYYLWNPDYSSDAKNKSVCYSYITNRYNNGATITVNGKDTLYYVIIATVGSRVRISDTHP